MCLKQFEMKRPNAFWKKFAAKEISYAEMNGRDIRVAEFTFILNGIKYTIKVEQGVRIPLNECVGFLPSDIKLEIILWQHLSASSCSTMISTDMPVEFKDNLIWDKKIKQMIEQTKFTISDLNESTQQRRDAFKAYWNAFHGEDV